MRACPTSPSLESFSSDGTTTVSSWRMIEAVMYGMIPSANTAIRESPPPLNVFSRLRIPPPPNCACTDADGVDVHSRDRDVGADAVDREKRCGEQHLLADLRNGEGAENRGDHAARS